RISMSRIASPYDNAQAESFIKTLKIRGSLSHGISQPGRCTGSDWRVPGENLQPRPPAFGARLSSTTGVRAPPAPRPSCEERIGMSFLRHGEFLDPLKVFAI